MPSVDPATPQSLLAQYRRLTTEQQTEFLRLVAAESTAAQFINHALALPVREFVGVTSHLAKLILDRVTPMVFMQAAQFATGGTGNQLEVAKQIADAASQAHREVEEGIRLREQHNLKEQRERKPASETIRRNIEICDLRRADPKRWSQRALGKRFGVSRQYIKTVLDAETHWRRLGGGN